MIAVTAFGAWALVELSGEFDVLNAEEIRCVVADLVAQTVTDVTIDMSAVTLLGAAGLNALVAANALIEGVKGRLVILGATGQTCKLFEVTGLTRPLRLVQGPGLLEASAPAITGGAEPSGGSDPAEVDDLSTQLFELGRLLLNEPAITHDLRRVVRTAVQVVPNATAASITVSAQGEPRTAAVSDSVAIEVDAAQYISGEGPCLDAGRLGQRVRLDVVGADEHFSHFAPLALRAGIRAVLSIPVNAGNIAIGSLNLYSTTTFPAAAEAPAEIIAALAAMAIITTDTYAAAHAAAQSAQQRLQADADINIAIGVLTGLQGCSLQQARQLLRSAASVNDEPLHQVARRIIAAVTAGGP
jgi:anti-anti-sigma factor